MSLALCICLAGDDSSKATPKSFQPGTQAPSFAFDFFQGAQAGKTFDQKNFEDQVILIDFFATWCQPCKTSIPHINALAKTFADEPIIFISLTYEPANMLKPFLRRFPMATQVAIDQDFATFKAFSAWGIPDVVIINTKGEIAARLHPNHLTEAVIREVLAGNIPDAPISKPWHDPAGAEAYFRSLIKK